MRHIITLFCLLTLFFIEAQEYKEMISKGTYSVNHISVSAKKYFKKNGKDEDPGYKHYKRWEYQAERMADKDGYLRNNSFYINELERYNKKQNEFYEKSSAFVANWEELGPRSRGSNLNQRMKGIGRLTSLVIDEDNSNHMIVGSQTGGVWKTIDRGLTWITLCDNFTDMNVYALAMHPENSNIYYWGARNGALYKTEDAGATWHTLADIGKGSYINKILINPNNPKIMFISLQNSGFYRSENSGATWEKIELNDNTAYDIEFKPTKPNTIYATGNKFHKSTDGGVNWITIDEGIESSVKQIAVSLANPSIVYVLEAPRSLFVSKNSGLTFTKKTLTGNNEVTFAPRNMGITVSPTNANEIYMGSLHTFRSLDGGNNFERTSGFNNEYGYCHVDIDDMLFYNEKLYVITDGGIFVASKPNQKLTKEYYENLSWGLGVHQLYKLGVEHAINPIILGGAQDLGTGIKRNGIWKEWDAGDGMECFVDKNNPNILYTTSQHGFMARSNDYGLTLDYSYGSPEGESGFWVSPFEQDPIKDNTVYIGYNFVYKSINGGKKNSWTRISQDFGSELRNLKIAPTNNKIMFASTKTALFKTTTGNGTWSLVEGLNGGFITSIAIHPKKPDLIAVAVNDDNKVYISKNGGNSWNTIKAGLPNFNPLALVWQDNNKDGLYLGMNFGVYYIDNTLSEWQNFSNLLPNVRIGELEINEVEGKLYAATYGRGLWKTSLYSGDNTMSLSEDVFLNTNSVFPNPVRTDFTVSFNQKIKAELRLFDTSGKLLYYDRLKEIKSKTIDISNYNTGTYFLRISTEAGIITKKIIKP